MARQNPNPPMDRDALHRVWFRRASRSGKLKIVQTEWAEMLGCTNHTLSRVLKEFVEEGRVKKVGYCLYHITDPQQFVEGEVQPSTSTRQGDKKVERKPVWG